MNVGIAVLVINNIIKGETVDAGTKFARGLADAFEHPFYLAKITGKKGGNAAGFTEVKTFEDNTFSLCDHTYVNYRKLNGEI